MTASEGHRRLRPRLWDTDWLVLRNLSAALQARLPTTVRRSGSVLDFGCGSMPYRAVVEQHDAKYVGADFDPEAGVRISSEGRLPLDNSSFDAVMSIQVLEHVRDLDRYLGEAHRVLKPGGKLLLSTHGSWLYHPHPEDHRRWTRTGLIHDIEARGFRVEEIDALVGPLATSTLIRLSGYCFFLRRIPFIGRILAVPFSIFMNLRAAAEEWVTPRSIVRDNACIYLTQCAKAAA